MIARHRRIDASGWRLPLAALAVLTVAAATLVSTLPTTPASARGERAGGFRLVWKDDFNGRAGQPLSGRWIYDTGHGYGCDGCPDRWGTGEIESMSASTDNVFPNARGQLVIRALREPDGTWTSGRVET